MIKIEIAKPTKNPLELTSGDIVLLRDNGVPEEIIDLEKSVQLTQLLAVLMLAFRFENNQFISNVPENYDDNEINKLGFLMTHFFALKVLNPVRQQMGAKVGIDTIVLPENQNELTASSDTKVENSLFSYKQATRQFLFSPSNDRYKQSFIQLQQALQASRPK